MPTDRRIAIIIIGGAKAGKSSVIRALTGAGNPTRKGAPKYDLEDRYGNTRRFLIIHSSPQEKNIPPTRFLSSRPYDEICKVQHDVLILGLQMNHRWDASQYINLLMQQGYDVRVVFIENPTAHLRNYVVSNNIPYIVRLYMQGNTPSDPFRIAADIRRSVWPP